MPTIIQGRDWTFWNLVQLGEMEEKCSKWEINKIWENRFGMWGSMVFNLLIFHWDTHSVIQCCKKFIISPQEKTLTNVKKEVCFEDF